MPEAPRTWQMVALAAVLQNMTTGLLFGTFGTMLFAIEAAFKADRGQSTLTMSLAVVSLSLAAAWLGSRIGKQRLRPLMLGGCALSAIGFLILAATHSLPVLWAVYLLLLGPGAGLAGVLATNTLAAAWSDPEKRGRALGWVNAPIFVTIAPLATAWILEHYGLRAVFLSLALCQFALLPLHAMVREPEIAAAEAFGAPVNRPSLLSPMLVLLVLVVGVISGGGLLKLSHLIPLVTAQGHSFDKANLLLSISGATGVIGSLLLGWLADKIGAGRTLALNAAVQAITWIILLVPMHYSLLVVDAVVVGICGGGLQAVIGALLSRLYDKAAFARVYGLLSLLTLPFMFGIPWLAGVLYVTSGGYRLPISIQIAGFFLSALGALMLASRERASPV